MRNREPFKNDWNTHPTFIDLGSADYSIFGTGALIKRDLYACKPDGSTGICFGCTFSDADGHYSNGSAQLVESKWIIVGDDEVHIAAARYFANHNGELL